MNRAASNVTSEKERCVTKKQSHCKKKRITSFFKSEVSGAGPEEEPDETRDETRKISRKIEKN